MVQVAGRFNDITGLFFGVFQRWNYDNIKLATNRQITAWFKPGKFVVYKNNSQTLASPGDEIVLFLEDFEYEWIVRHKDRVRKILEEQYGQESAMTVLTIKRMRWHRNWTAHNLGGQRKTLYEGPSDTSRVRDIESPQDEIRAALGRGVELQRAFLRMAEPYREVTGETARAMAALGITTSGGKAAGADDARRVADLLTGARVYIRNKDILLIVADAAVDELRQSTRWISTQVRQLFGYEYMRIEAAWDEDVLLANDTAEQQDRPVEAPFVDPEGDWSGV